MPPRFFRHGELPLVLLAILDERPRHGYDIMAELTRLFGPRYRPSPGSIYPAIEALHTEELIHGQHLDGKVVYALTEQGQQALQDRADLLAALEVRVGVRVGSDGDSLESHLNQFRARLAPLSGLVDPAEADIILRRAALEIELLPRPTRPKKKKRHSHAG